MDCPGLSRTYQQLFERVHQTRRSVINHNSHSDGKLNEKADIEFFRCLVKFPMIMRGPPPMMDDGPAEQKCSNV